MSSDPAVSTDCVAPPDASDSATDAASSSRIRAADVVFVAQDGFKLAPARVRCYGFARQMNRQGLRAEVLSFYDHLGASDHGGPVAGASPAEKLRLNARATALLTENPRAVLYVQKAGYHVLACMAAAARNGNPIILDYDDYDLDGRCYAGLDEWLPDLTPRGLLQAAAGKAYACVVSSRSIRDFVAPLNPRTELIHTVADRETFDDAGRNRPRVRLGDKVNILWCGDVWGHVPMKDLFFATEAFAALPPSTRAKAAFHIVGFGKAWETTKERMRRGYGVDGLTLHDFIPPAEMPDVFAETDIGVLPYFDNHFNRAKSPTKMFEYMLAGVTVLSTPVGEAPLCLQDGRSALFAEGVDGFAAALARLIDDDGLRRRLAAEAKALALAEFSLQGVGPRLEALIRDALAARTRADGGDGAASPAEFMGAALGRRLPVAPREIELALNDLAALARSADLAAESPRRWTAPLFALLRWPGLKAYAGVPPEQAAALAAAGSRLRLSARLRPLLGPVARPAPSPASTGGPPSLCKFASARDWECPDWFRRHDLFKTNLATFVGDGWNVGGDPRVGIGGAGEAETADRLNHIYSFYKRSGGAWMRTHLLYGLERLGLSGDDRALLSLGVGVDGLHLHLSEWAGRVDAVNLGPNAQADAATVAAGGRDPWLAKARVFRPDRLQIRHDGFPPDALHGTWDAVVVAPEAEARLNDPAVIARIVAQLKPGGVLALTARHPLTAGAPAEPPAALQSAGFVPVEAFDPSVDDETLDRTARAGTDDFRHPHFATETDDDLMMPAVWFCRRAV